MVLPSSGTLTFRRRASEPLRCQKGTVSWVTTVSLSEVGERPMDNADSLSDEKVGRDWPRGLLNEAEGQNWYLEVAAEGLFSKGEMDSIDSSESALRFLSDLERRGAK